MKKKRRRTEQQSKAARDGKDPRPKKREQSYLDLRRS